MKDKRKQKENNNRTVKLTSISTAVYPDQFDSRPDQQTDGQFETD